MKKRITRWLVLLLTTVLFCLLAGCSSNDGQANGTGTEIAAAGNTNEAESGNQTGSGEPDPEVYFIKGADISSLEAVEDYGGKFYGFDGEKVDPIPFLMENGCNYFRLRIWNEPTRSFDAGDYCNLDHTLKMAKRIKDAGAKFLLDFHYSDWWADPDNQTIPVAWKEMDEEQLIRAVYDYTAEVLNALGEEGAYPDMVQIGNEIGNGMLWPYGGLDHPETLAALVNSGIQAVRDTTPQGQETQIMIHVQDGGSVGATEIFFETLEANGVSDYDIVGLSYYPYWHGTFSDLKANIENIYDKFGKQVVLAETAYPFTTKSADGNENLVRDKDLAEVGFEASEENQKLVLELTMNAVATSEGGLGIYYWEPAWLAVEGAGVSKGSGNEWENQALFDFEGKALEGVKAFSYLPGSLDNEKALLVYPFESLEIDADAEGEDVLEELPAEARVLYLDGSIRKVPIEWDISSRKEITGTRVAYKGKVLDFEISAGAELVDKYSLNNLDFEEGTSGWSETDEKGVGQICNDGNSYPHSGEWSYQYWSADAFDIDLYQMVRIARSDEYHLQVWSQGIQGSGLNITLYIADKEGNILAGQDFTNDGWDVWQHPLVSAQLQEGDIVRIGVQIQGTPDDWGTLDQFTFYTGEQEETADNVDHESGAGQDGSDDPASGDTENSDGSVNNLLSNPSMENGDAGWTVTRENTAAGTIRNDNEGNPHSGEYSFHYWNETDFTIDLFQTVTVKENGSYVLSAFSQGDADTGTALTLYVKDAEGKELYSADWSNQGWDVWQNPAISDIMLEGGQEITVGIVISGKAGGWGTLDDISLILAE